MRRLLSCQYPKTVSLRQTRDEIGYDVYRNGLFDMFNPSKSSGKHHQPLCNYFCALRPGTERNCSFHLALLIGLVLSLVGCLRTIFEPSWTVLVLVAIET